MELLTCRQLREGDFQAKIERVEEKELEIVSDTHLPY